MSKQPAQHGGEKECCVPNQATPYKLWNVFSRSSLRYTMMQCDLCKKRSRFDAPDWDCNGVGVCCKGTASPYTEYAFRDASKRLQKCLCCGKETWLAF